MYLQTYKALKPIGYPLMGYHNQKLIFCFITSKSKLTMRKTLLDCAIGLQAIIFGTKTFACGKWETL